MKRDRKEIGNHPAHHAQHAPIARLCARFGIPTPPADAEPVRATSTLPASTPTLIEQPVPPPKNEARPGRVPPGFTADVVIVIADADGYTDGNMKGANRICGVGSAARRGFT